MYSYRIQCIQHAHRMSTPLAAVSFILATAEAETALAEHPAIVREPKLRACKYGVYVDRGQHLDRRRIEQTSQSFRRVSTESLLLPLRRN